MVSIIKSTVHVTTWYSSSAVTEAAVESLSEPLALTGRDDFNLLKHDLHRLCPYSPFTSPQKLHPNLCELHSSHDVAENLSLPLTMHHLDCVTNPHFCVWCQVVIQAPDNLFVQILCCLKVTIFGEILIRFSYFQHPWLQMRAMKALYFVYKLPGNFVRTDT